VNQNEQQLLSEHRVAIQNCVAAIRLARATELAQSGRLLEAEAVLVQDGELPSTANELDLLARIAARQGRFGEARRRWESAMQLDPGNAIYCQCLANLTPARRFASLLTHHQDTLLNVLVWTTIALAIAVLLHTLRR
jgi:Flp pilus assembly protein TadD